jgi:hypothetical protein
MQRVELDISSISRQQGVSESTLRFAKHRDQPKDVALGRRLLTLTNDSSHLIEILCMLNPCSTF